MDRHTVLIVEDDDESRQLLSEILELEGFKVAAASNGAEALQYLQYSERPCLIVLDVFMPVMDGRQFRTLQLKDHKLAKIPTVVLSAQDPSSISDLAATKVIRKPLDVNDLLGVLRDNC
jgi:CheY-like chemotaxis protein